MASSFRKNQTKTSTRKSAPLISSPSVKRLQNRPVALQGWLLKRGSDGLMLWKKRWFVLSDYCLFYYKDTLEEKLLGSLILASYHISQCSPDEKGYKKYSFKAEHTNMRTYYFAAENQGIMDQWIKAMTLASLLEENICDERLSSESGKAYNQQSRHCVSPSQDIAGLCGPRTPDPQPVYANAPPKPKRLNESSSPECSTDIQFREDCYQNYQNQSYHIIYNNINPTQQYYAPAPIKQGFVQYDRNAADVYGRLDTLQTLRKSSNQNSLSSTTQAPLKIPKDNSHNSKNVSFSFPPRPHSVDFLEYSGKTSSDMSHESPEINKLHSRPKSSMSTLNAHDDDTWTAEEYAKRMRQSSLYVKPTAKRSLSAKVDAPSGSPSNSSHNSIQETERQMLKNNLGTNSEKMHGVMYRTKNMAGMQDDPKFARSASARLFRPMSDCREELHLQNIPGNFLEQLQPDNIFTKKESSNKVYQREEAMKRLLEWKNRMTHSSLRKPHGKSYTPERHSSYLMPMRSDPYSSGMISPSITGNENLEEHMTPSNSLMNNSENILNHASNQLMNETIRNIHISTPSGPCYQFSSDDDGLGGCESKYGNTGSIFENNIIERERTKVIDVNSKIQNETNIGHKNHEPIEPIDQMQLSDGLEFSNDNIFSNFKPDSNVSNIVESPLNSNCEVTNNNEDENEKNKLTNMAIQDYHKHMNLSHSVENERDEEWGIKLDESKVIKEFSYHYITTGKYEECQTKNEIDSRSNCNFKSKRKSSQDFDVQSCKQNSLNKQMLQSRNDFQNCSFNEPNKQVGGTSRKKENNVFQKITGKGQKKSKGIITKGNSVRTYRRESNKPHPQEIVNKSIAVNDNTDRRLVQSDSEALLYDTSSDVEERIVFHRDHLEKGETSSDEEVAAVLSKENIFTSPVFDTVTSPYRKCNSAVNLELDTTNFLSNDLKMQSNCEQSLLYQINHEKNLSTSTDVNSDVPEENYMPMTPRKKSQSSSIPESIHSRSNSASHTMIIENLLGSVEESPYVEMTQTGSRSRKSFNKRNFEGKNESIYILNADESERYCEIGKNKDIQYEIIYNSSTTQEPLYMEVPSIKEKDEEKSILTLLKDNETVQDFNKRSNSKENLSQLNLSSRPSLPDILSTTAPTLNQGSGQSDSSDADDEASKDLDSLDAPRHPRFSLSDTFRPASYYLGASLGDRTIITMNTEQHDSSDSDLVSPPPIPTSSPPLDDLETSMESTIVNKESSISNLKSDVTNIYSNELFLHHNVKDYIPSYKIKNSLRNSNSNLYEASSEESVNFEKREQRLKRRPLSADILSSLQDINFIMPSSDSELKDNATDGTKINPVFDETQVSIESDQIPNLKLYKNKNTKLDNFFTTRDEISNDNDSENDMRYKDNRYIQSEPIYSTGAGTSPIVIDTHSMRNQYENLPASNSDYKYFIEKYNCKESTDNFKEKLSYIKENKSASSHSNEHQNNAPYYYSDLLKIDTKNFHEFDKNRWEGHILEDNEKDPSLPCDKTVTKIMNYNQYSDSDVSKLNPSLSDSFRDQENCKYEANNSPTKVIKDSFDYSKYSMNNENTNKNVKKKYSPEQQLSEVHTPQRTRSLEGLIDNHPISSRSIHSDTFKSNSSLTLNSKVLHGNTKVNEDSSTSKSIYQPNQDLWEEDTLWRENLRKVSIRHTRSLEDLDRKDCSQIVLPPSANSPGETKTYENVKVSYLHDKHTKYSKDNSESSSSKIHLKQEYSFQNEKSPDKAKHCDSPKHIDSDVNQKNSEERSRIDPGEGNNTGFEIDREKLRQWDLMSSAPAMLSSNRAVIKPITERKPNIPSSIPGNHSQPDISLDKNLDLQNEAIKTEKPSPITTPGLPLTPEQEQGQAWNLKVSAGELLGRTHEELVLLLIQLRRQRATVCQSMEKCHREIESKACLADLDKANRIEHLQKLDELKAKLADLEKQYEKGKPLVNLVDNMVKLGSLYQAGSPQKIEFIQRIQEQRLLAEERRDWDRIRPDHHELKAKVERLYRLDKLLQEESGTLHSLQQDKGVLERALGGLRTKLQGIHGNSPETEWYKRQQRLLERELSRVRSILALNSKKLEETVSENARLEQELVVLRQKLQLSRRSTEPGSTNTAALEAELCRVQLLVGNLLRQRQELSLQVRQLTEKSNSLSQQIWPNSPDHSAEGLCYGKKQLTNGWIETDLDADVSTDISNMSSVSQSTRHQPAYISPLYVNTADRECVNDCSSYPDELFDSSPLSVRSPDCSRVSENIEEEIFKQSYGFHLKEKPQEIKTVRIVKRESERRQRDRDRSGNIGIPITYTNPKRPSTDDRFSDKIKTERDLEEAIDLEYRTNEPPPTPGPRTDSVNAVWNLVRKNKMKGKLICRNTFEKSDSLVMQTDSPQLSPVYLSETARKIVEEVAWQGMSEKRLVPKEKRRHHTMSGPSLIAPQSLFSQMGSRDDLDIERVLRPRLTTPDVVRSTLIRVDPHYTKETIDNILGAPGKILIPERYIPESQPQLTKEEQNKRSKKADAIRKMLCETTAVAPKETDTDDNSSSLKRKVAEEKKNREHLLQLSQILAQQVMEKSKIVAVMAIASLPQHVDQEEESEEEEYSSFENLPLYQQRDNFFS